MGMPAQHIIVEAAKSNPWVTIGVGIVVAVVSGVIMELIRRRK